MWENLSCDAAADAAVPAELTCVRVRARVDFCEQWFAKARRQATLALNRAKSVNYDPLEDPKYALDAIDDDDDDEDEEDDDDE